MVISLSSALQEAIGGGGGGGGVLQYTSKRSSPRNLILPQSTLRKAVLNVVL